MKKGKFEIKWNRTKLWFMIMFIVSLLYLFIPATSPLFGVILLAKGITGAVFYYFLAVCFIDIAEYFVKKERVEQAEFDFEKEKRVKSEDLKP